MTFIFLTVGGLFALCIIISIRKCGPNRNVTQVVDADESDEDIVVETSAPLAAAPLAAKDGQVADLDASSPATSMP